MHVWKLKHASLQVEAFFKKHYVVYITAPFTWMNEIKQHIFVLGGGDEK